MRGILFLKLKLLYKNLLNVDSRLHLGQGTIQAQSQKQLKNPPQETLLLSYTVVQVHLLALHDSQGVPCDPVDRQICPDLVIADGDGEPPKVGPLDTDKLTGSGAGQLKQVSLAGLGCNQL